jgi:hypothetical protein
MKQVIGLFLKHHGMKEFVIFVILRRWRMKNTLLKCHAYTHIRSQFQNICNNINLHNMLTHQNYGDLRKLLSNLVKHKNKILKQTK